MAMKMRLKMKSRSHRYDINRPRPRHGHKHNKYKMCLSIMMVICIKQHLSGVHYASIFLHLTTLLTKKSPNDILPRKICVIKNFLPQEFQ